MELKARKRIARTIPFGYKVSAHDPNWLEPIPSQVQALNQAFEYLKTCSLEQTAAWLSNKTGRKLSRIGLRLIYNKLKIERARRYEENRKAKKSQLRIVERSLPPETESEPSV